jgi:hypothetical protein
MEWHPRLEQIAKSRASPPNIYSYHCPLRGDIRKNWNDTEKGSSARQDFNTEFQSGFLIWEFPFLDLNFDSALAWPLHKDDTLSRSGRSTDLNIYFILNG